MLCVPIYPGSWDILQYSGGYRWAIYRSMQLQRPSEQCPGKNGGNTGPATGQHFSNTAHAKRWTWMVWNGMEWYGMLWNGMQWYGMECSLHVKCAEHLILPAETTGAYPMPPFPPTKA